MYYIIAPVCKSVLIALLAQFAPEIVKICKKLGFPLQIQQIEGAGMMNNSHVRIIIVAGLVLVLTCGITCTTGWAENRTGHAPAKAPTSDAQTSSQIDRSLPPEVRAQFLEKNARPSYRLPAGTTFGIDDWQLAIDTTWGPGFDPAIEWTIYKTYWEPIDNDFVCFNGINVDWDSIRAADSAEIAGDVSRGRFIAMMQYASWELFEGHTMIYDDSVSYEVGTAPGKPLLFTGDWGSCNHFGAGVTLGLDGSLFVYQVGDSHPLGLDPGDIILGYDGVPWEEMYPQLLAENVPIVAWSSTGSTEESREHRMMSAVGRNWHMFDTLDVVKYSTGDTVHLPTNLMTTSTAYTMNSEQMDIPGVPKPDYFNGQRCSWGIIDGTTIGYIYVYDWRGNVDTLFHNAIDSLINHYTTTGLIFDYRLNWGGNIFLQMDGLSLLFGDTVLTLDWLGRCNTGDHLALCEHSDPPSYYQIPGDPSSYYDKPIAVLVGPGAISAGDMGAFFLSLHPKAKFFGKPTEGAFNQPAIPYIHSDFWSRYAEWDTYRVTNPGTTLTRKGFPNPSYFPDIPYAEVWLTRDSVAEGRDDVVEAAIEWITIGCCVGLTGNLDGDELADIADLTFLIDHLFINFPELPCPEEADFNFDTLVDISDLTFFIDNQFINFPPLPACGNGIPNSSPPKPASRPSIGAVYDNGATTITLNSPESLRGLQLQLTGTGQAEPICLLADGFDMYSGEVDGSLVVGIVDSDGPGIIPSGRVQMIRVEGEYAIESAIASDMNHRSMQLVVNNAVSSALPASYALEQNYPNPFNPTTEIAFTLPAASEVRLDIFNILGQKVTTLVDGLMAAGKHTITWGGGSVASGVYYYRLTVDSFVETKKMLLLK